jgi:hypothetical protein
MTLKGLAIFAVLLAVPSAPLAAAGQTGDRAGAPRQATPVAASPAPPPQGTGNAAGRSNCEGGACEEQPAHITVATPAPGPSPWLMRDQITWAANLVLVILGYAGILLALSLLRKIERQTRYGETAATAAAESAQAALLHAQTIVAAERPWILVTAEPSRSIENGFVVTATNRGRSPARIVAMAEETRFSSDEKHLPGVPEYRQKEPKAPLVPLMLLPGESISIKAFYREDVKELCETAERLRRVEEWEEKIFIYGRIIYADLIAPAGPQNHETGWCCWYIHGRQKSGMVMAGPPEYNLHT